MLQFTQEVVVVEAVDFFNVTKDDIAFATQGLGYILAWQFRDIILKKIVVIQAHPH